VRTAAHIENLIETVRGAEIRPGIYGTEEWDFFSTYIYGLLAGAGFFAEFKAWIGATHGFSSSAVGYMGWEIPGFDGFGDQQKISWVSRELRAFLKEQI
jgi:hypothetical protein